MTLFTTSSTLGADSADDKLIFFLRKQDLTVHANCLHWIKCQSLFTGKKYIYCTKKKMLSAENFYPAC